MSKLLKVTMKSDLCAIL